MSSTVVEGEPSAPPQSSRHPWVFAALAAIVLISRLPQIPGAGLGRDPDAWRLYLAGEATAAAGTYVPSRFPGYPFLELLSVSLRGAPWWVFTTLTAVMTTVGVLALSALARALGVRAWPLVGAAVAATNVIWQASTTYMDYNWALGFLALAMLATQQRRAAVAGVLAGLAVACRPTTVVAASVLLLVVLATPDWRWRRSAVFAGAGAAVVVAFFAVPLATWGTDLLTAVPAPPSVTAGLDLLRAAVGGQRAVLGVAVVLGLLVVRLLLRRGDVRWDRPRQVWLLALLVSIALQFALFVATPIDGGYLIPAIAMAWLAAGLVLNWVEMGLLTAAMVAGSLLSGAVVPSVPQVTAERRAAMVDSARRLEVIRGLPEGSIVVARGELPILVALADAVPSPSINPLGGRARIPLDTGQVLARNYERTDPEGRTYRVEGVGEVPLSLPVVSATGVED